MSTSELRGLWAALVAGRLDGELSPRERLAAWHARARGALDRVRGLGLGQLASVHRRVLAGEDLDAIADELPPTRPASDDAGVPTEGRQ
jgi:hypothetical protein